MTEKRAFDPENLHYLKMLSKQYPTVQAASTEIINLRAILALPKGTEHFVSDIHGEYEAFRHILHSASGEVREKVDELFAGTLSKQDRDQLTTLIYYPEEKLEEVERTTSDMREWYRVNLHRLVELCCLVSVKYTRSKVRKAMPPEYAYIMDELVHTRSAHNEADKRDYYEGIIGSIIDLDRATNFLIELCRLIKRLSVDRLHVVGDIFDRGPGAHIVMDTLMKHHSVDIQWGNHDILWMGAASGSRTLVATVLANSLRYDNMEVIETGYGISLRPLSDFASRVYARCDVSRWQVKMDEEDSGSAPRELDLSDRGLDLTARMHKAITIILFKLEGQKILRNPSFGMDDRLLLDKIDYEHKTVVVDGKTYPLADTDFPTVDPKDPYALTTEEAQLIERMTYSFVHSEKLQQHIRYLYSKGSLYTVYNGNLLFHGCIPMTEDGELMKFSIGCDNLSGKAFLDYADATARKAYYYKAGSPEQQAGQDFLWFLWCGRNSPIYGRDRMTTFERRLIDDESVWKEQKNAYYRLYNDPAVCGMLLKEFGLEGPHCHIINGHIPVKSKKGESPIKGGGRLLVIDGGFCKAYQKTTGIAGYTLIYTSRCLRLVSHQPFAGREQAIKENTDIASSSEVIEWLERRARINDTDIGVQLREQVDNLMALLDAYRSGAIAESHQG